MTDDELLNYLYHTKKMFGGVQQLYAAAKIRHPKIKKSFLKKSGNPDDDLLAWAAISCYFWFYLYYIMW